jgi:polysaccharide biosynthesis protein PelB
LFAGDAPLPQRRGPVLAGAPLLVGFAFVMGVVMTVVCPTGREYAALSDNEQADAYSIAYLTVLTRADPRDANLALVYVRQLAQLGRWDDALGVLERAPGDARGPERRMLRLGLLLSRARTMPADTPERAHAFGVVHAELAVGPTGFPAARAGELAPLALELEDPNLAARFYLAAAEASAPSRAASLAAAGRWFRAGGEGARSAESFERASTAALEPAQKTAYLLEAAASLEASRGACAAADSLASPSAASDDVELLRRATAATRACARSHEAKLLGRRLVSLTRGDVTEMKAQVRRELEAGDAAGALALLRELVAREPRDATLRAATARVAEWAGQPQVALTQWLWLLANGRTPSSKLALP